MANTRDDRTFTRRDLLKGGGALIISWSLPLPSLAQRAGTDARAAARAGTGVGSPPPNRLDSWLRIAADGKVTALSGAIETGQGKRVAWRQIIAEELDAPLESITLQMGDTLIGPNQGNSG